MAGLHSKVEGQKGCILQEGNQHQTGMIYLFYGEEITENPYDWQNQKCLFLQYNVTVFPKTIEIKVCSTLASRFL